MKYSEAEYYQTNSDLTASNNPTGAIFGALIGAVPAVAFYALIVNVGPLPYVFILSLLLIPTLMIALAARFSGKIYAPKHRLWVVATAMAVHVFGIHYFHLIKEAYFVLPLIFLVAFLVTKRSLSKIESIVVDMESEGRFENK